MLNKIKQLFGIKPKKEVDKVVNWLNGLLEADRDTISSLLHTRFLLNKNNKLIDDDFLTTYYSCYNDTYEVGPLGLVNGLLELLKIHTIRMVCDNNNKILKFEKM